MVAPLLDLAGFCLPPFYVDTETSVELVVPGASAAALPSPDLRSDEPASDQPASDLTLRGRMDVLVGLGRLWVLVIESKRSAFSTAIGIPQVLSYRLTASPAEPGDRYGLVTNGSHFVFVKLGPVSPDRWDYAKSQEFILDRKDDLAQVLQIMKQLGAIALQPHTAAVPPAPAELDRGDPGDGVSGD